MLPLLRSIASVAALVAALAAPAVAQDAASAAPDTAAADTSVMQLPEVLVRGTKPDATPGGSGIVQAQLDSLRFPASPTMECVLRSLPMTYVRTNSRGEAEVTVRGSESRQVAILVDGVPLTYSWDGRADVSVIPALAPQEVTLVRGLTSMMEGTNTLGGVVHFNTVSANHSPADQSLRLTAGADQVGGYGVTGAVTLPRAYDWGRMTLRAGAGHRDSPGQPLADGVVEPVPTDDDLRLNTDVNETNGFAALRLDSKGGPWVSLAGAGYQAERGIAAQLGVSGARYWRYPFMARGIGALSAGTGDHRMPWGGEADIQMSAGYDRGRTEIDAYDSADYSVIDSEEDGNDEVWTFKAQAAQSLPNQGNLRLGYSYGDIEHEEILDGVSNFYRQRLTSVAGQTLIVLPLSGALHQLDLSLGAAYDQASTPLSGNKPSFGSLDLWGGRAGVSAHFANALTAHASASQRARFPSLRELYSGSLGSFEPNPDLEPERLQVLEAGITKLLGRSRMQLIGFHHLLSDAVVRIRTTSGTFKRVNQEGIRSTGAEVLASHAFGRLELSGDFTAQHVEVLDPASGLEQPENMPELMGALRAQLPIRGWFEFAVEGRFTGEQFVIDPETGEDAELAAAGQLNLEVSRNWPIVQGPWFTGLQTRLAIDNVTDTAQYDAYGLPEPGRTFRIEFRTF